MFLGKTILKSFIMSSGNLLLKSGVLTKYSELLLSGATQNSRSFNLINLRSGLTLCFNTVLLSNSPLCIISLKTKQLFEKLLYILNYFKIQLLQAPSSLVQ